MRNSSLSPQCKTYKLNALVDIMLTKTISCNFTEYFNYLDNVLTSVTEEELDLELKPSHMPFDTLLLKTTQNYRTRVAKLYSSHLWREDWSSGLSSPVDSEISSERIKLGFASFDWGNHPTAHLMLGLFHGLSNSSKKTLVFDLGIPDGMCFYVFANQCICAF